MNAPNSDSGCSGLDSGPLQNQSSDAVDPSTASSAQRARLPFGSPISLCDTGEALCAISQGAGGALRDGWIDFLSRYSLQWFCTLTFAESVHEERAFKSFRQWTNELNRSLHGKRWSERGRGIYWVLAWEYQARGVLHFHALLGDSEDLNNRARRLTWMDRWSEMAGFARIEDIKDRSAVDRYVSTPTTPFFRR